MKRWLLRRLLLMVPTLLGITLVTFAIIHLAPGDPAVLAMGDDAPRLDVSQEAIAHFRATMGLDAPLHVQYARWLVRVARLDFGTSWRSGRAVTSLVAERLPTTLLLSTIALLLAYAIAVPLGVRSATRQGSLSDRVTTFFLFLLHSMPVPFVAIVIVLFLAGGRYLRVLPIQGLHAADAATMSLPARVLDTVWHLIAPVACLTYGAVAGLSRYMRAAMLDVVREGYVRTARAKGLSERAVVWRHAARNSLLPMVTLLGLYLPYLIGGSVIVERIFGIDGMGMLAFRAALERDYDVIMGISTLSALLTMAALLLSDLLYSLVDPRIRLE